MAVSKLSRWLSQAARAIRTSSPVHRVPLRCEALEDRLAPAVHTWTDGGVTNDWSSVGNWLEGSVPTLGEGGAINIVIPINDPTMNQNIVGLTINGIQFTNSGSSTLTLIAPLVIDGSIVNTSGTNTITGSNSLIPLFFPCFISVDTGTLRIISQITGDQGIVKTGPGQLTLSTTVGNTYTGTTTIAEGTLVLNTSTSNAGLSNNIFVGTGTGAASSAILRLPNTDEIPNDSTITIASDGLLDVLAGGSDVITSLVLNAGALAIANTSTFALRSGGSVTTTAAATSSTITGAGNFQLGATTTFTIAAGAAATDLRISAVVSEGGVPSGLVKAGAGTLELAETTNNTYTGTTTIVDGTLLLNTTTGNAGLSNNIVVGDGSGAASSAILRLPNTFEIPDAATLTIRTDGLVDVLAGGSEDLQTLVLNGGALAIASTGIFTITSGGSVTTNAAATTSTIAGAGSFRLNATTTFTIANGGPATDLRISAAIAEGNPARGLIKAGIGTLELAETSANTYTGATTIADGTLLLNTSTTNAGLSNNIVVGDGTGAAGSAILRLPNNDEIPNNGTITINGDGLVDVLFGRSEVIATLVLNGGALAIANTGTFALGSTGSVTTNAAASSSTIAGLGRFQLGATTTFTIANGAAASDLLISAVVSDGGAVSGLIKAGAGTLELAETSANTYSGTTTIAEGTLLLNTTTGNAGLSNTIFVGDGTGGASTAVLQLPKTFEIPDAATLTIRTDGLVDVLAGGNEDLQTLVLNGGALAIANTGIFTLFSGGSVATTAAATSSTITGLGSFRLNATTTFTIADGAAAPDLRISAIISDGGTVSGLIKVGAGTLELAGTIANTYTGETTVTLGTLLLNSGALNGAIPRALTIGDPLGAVGAASVVLQQSSQIANAIPVTIRRGLLDLNGRTEQVNGLILSEGQVNSRTGLLEVTGNISSVAGTLPSTIAGRLDLRTATRTFTVDRGSATVDLEIDSTVANGGIIKNGAGRMVLTGTNTYSGSTILNAGILEIDGSQRNSPVTVTGGTLGGSGVIGTITGTGGIINPGSENVVGPDSLETLSVGLGAVTYAPDLMFNTALGLPGSDELVVTGSVDVTGATLAPILTNTPLIGNRFTIIENDGSDPVIGTFNGRPEGAIFPVGGTTFQITYKGGDGNDVVVTVLTALPGNTPPTISNILDQASTGAAVGPLPFTIADAETPVGNLQTTAASSNQIVVPDSGIIIIGNGASRTITLTPAAGQAGTTTITVTVTDGNGAMASDTYIVTISPPPPPPPAVSASPILVGGATNGSVGVFNPTNPSTATYSAGNSVSPFGGIASNVRVASGDVNGDGVRDFIVVTGPGVPIQLAVINGKDNSILVAPFDPFPPALGGAPFTGGGFVSSADMDKKIGDEFAVSPDITGGPRVTIYSLVNGTLSTRANFFAVDPDFRGGARIAIGDANGDGFGDLMIGAGFGGGPRVQLLDGTKAINGFPAQPLQTDKLINDFFAFDSNLRDGSFLAIGDVNGDGSNELIFGAGDGGPLQVVVVTAKQFLSDGSLANPIARFNPTGLGGDGSGARVAVASTGNGSQVNVVVGTGKRALGVAKVYPGTSFTNGMTTEPAGGKVLVNSSILVDGIYVG